jgi:isopentenyl-diphosphate delta-isomerase
MDEMLDLVDQNDTVIDKKLRSEIYAEKLSNFRVVNAFLINQEGKLWIPRRSANKKLFPLCLDTSMGGHVKSGESYENAFFRELHEEVGIDASKEHYSYLGSLNPYTHGTSAFMKVYALHIDFNPSYNTQDFIEYFWLYPQEVLDLLKNGEKSKDDLPKIIKHLFLKF